MTIPDSQLQTWSNQGATVTALTTHTSIRNAIKSYKNWPADLQYDIYLQGSYVNDTNIYGNSDVDLVVELTSVNYSNLTDSEKTRLNLLPGKYGWNDFRTYVLNALTDYYGSSLIDTSGIRSIKILPDSGRLKGDVVIAVTYKYYYDTLRVRSEGITFWNFPQMTTQYVNYPKLHIENGSQKNSTERTHGWFKHTIRIFKNARDKILEKDPSLKNRFPSYFIENLLYNVPDKIFGGSYQQSFLDPLNWLRGEVYNDHASKFVCQNGMFYLFSNNAVTWNLIDATLFLAQLTNLWERW